MSKISEAELKKWRKFLVAYKKAWFGDLDKVIKLIPTNLTKIDKGCKTCDSCGKEVATKSYGENTPFQVDLCDKCKELDANISTLSPEQEEK